MNERIRNLQIQAFAECKTFEDDKIRTDEVFERFAGLIVGECMDLVKDCYAEPGRSLYQSVCASTIIEEHFGVEKMNERLANNKIYLLAKEAGLIEFEKLAWNPELQSPTYESVAKARKFAELIVQECIGILNKPYFVMEKKVKMSRYNEGWVNGRLLGIDHIREHFGVEE